MQDDTDELAVTSEMEDEYGPVVDEDELRRDEDELRRCEQLSLERLRDCNRLLAKNVGLRKRVEELKVKLAAAQARAGQLQSQVTEAWKAGAADVEDEWEVKLAAAQAREAEVIESLHLWAEADETDLGGYIARLILVWLEDEGRAYDALDDAIDTAMGEACEQLAEWHRDRIREARDLLQRGGVAASGKRTLGTVIRVHREAVEYLE